MTKPTEAELLAKRDAAKKRVKEWWDKPEHKPTKELEEKARHGDIRDPKQQAKNDINPDADDGTPEEDPE